MLTTRVRRTWHCQRNRGRAAQPHREFPSTEATWLWLDATGRVAENEDPAHRLCHISLNVFDAPSDDQHYPATKNGVPEADGPRNSRTDNRSRSAHQGHELGVYVKQRQSDAVIRLWAQLASEAPLDLRPDNRS
jgi:hypothetical protein